MKDYLDVKVTLAKTPACSNLPDVLIRLNSVRVQHLQHSPLDREEIMHVILFSFIL